MEPSKAVRVLMVGLDAAGKTTILYWLQLGKLVTTIPSIGYNKETVQHKNTDFTFFDIGGLSTVRILWQYYYEGSQGVIFVVDSSDRARIDEAKEDLMKKLDNDEIRDIPLLVFANKQDLPDAMSVSEVTDKLGLPNISKSDWHVQATCGTSGSGLHEGLDWLAEQIMKRSSSVTPLNDADQN